MPAHPVEVDPEKMRWAQRLYEETSMPNALIAAFLGISKTTLQDRIPVWNWRHRLGTRISALDKAARLVADLRRPAPTSPPAGQAPWPMPPAVPLTLGAGADVDAGRSLAERLRGAVEREVARVEAAGADPRALATLVRAANDLKRLEGALGEDAGADGAGADDADIDLDELRREFSERIGRLREQRPEPSGGG